MITEENEKEIKEIIIENIKHYAVNPVCSTCQWHSKKEREKIESAYHIDICRDCISFTKNWEISEHEASRIATGIFDCLVLKHHLK